MTAKAVIKVLKANGWVLDRQSGSHKVFKKDGRICSVAYHQKDIPIGTLKNIERITGVRL